MLAQCHLVSRSSQDVEMRNQRLQVRIFSGVLESETVFEGDGEGIEQVDGAQLGEKIPLSQLLGFVVALFDVYPNQTSHVARDQ